MSNSQKTCPICKLPDQNVLAERDHGDKVAYECKRCGKFTISRTAEAVAEHQQQSAELSGWIRERNIRKIDIPLLDSYFMEELISSLPKYSPREKQIKLLKAVEILTDYPGREVVLIPEHEVSLAWASNEEEFQYYVNSLMERGLLRIPNKGHRSIDDPLYPMVITAEGWEYLEKEQGILPEKTQAFIAMSFDPALKPIYDNAIFPAVTATGHRPYRVDSYHHLDRIDAKIIAEIKNSRFVVADVTQQKAGVYYEAGFAHGLGIPVIWSVKAEDLKYVHFDTRQYNHIVWKSEDELKAKLRDVILAVIGKK